LDEEDRKLVLDARVGMREAFTKLVDRYRGRVYGLAVSIMNDHASALELTRDTFVRAHKELPRLDDADRFPGWLARLTYREGREKRHGRMEDSEAELAMERSSGVPLDRLALEGSGATLATPFGKGEAELALLEALVAALPERVRVALDLRFREGLSYDEIAETLEVPRAQVPVLLARGARKLRSKLKPFLRRGAKS
jgi:RNA polymerase sigma-70 factor (ECF subfamily)